MRTILLSVALLVACDAPPAPPPAPTSAPAPLARSAIVAISASSHLAAPGASFEAAMGVDGDRATAWCEGVAGLGVGESITLDLAREVTLDGIEVDGGYFKDDRTLTNNGRPRRLRVQTDRGFDAELSLPFVPLREHRAEEIPVKPARLAGLGSASKLTLTVLEADAGRFTEDTCISEIVLFPAP